MINKTLFLRESKAGMRLLLIFFAVLTMYATMIIAMFDPKLGDSLAQMAQSMRSAGLPIEVLIEYVNLFQQGDKTIQARKEIFIEQRRQLAEKIEEMQKTLERLDYKIAAYENIVLEKEKLLRQ